MARPLRRFLHGRLLKRLARIEAGVAGLSVTDALGTARRARQLAKSADSLARRAEARVHAAGTAPMPPDLPPRTDWYAPAPLWSGRDAHSACPVPPGHALGSGATLHHDGEPDRLSARFVQQSPGAYGRGLVLDVLDFGGSYVSVSQALPEAAMQGIGRQTLVRAAFDLAMDRAVPCFARLNLRQGPNTGEMLRGLDMARGQKAVEFDLFYADVEPDAASEIWLDLIFERPFMVRVDLRGVLLSRRPRAGI